MTGRIMTGVLRPRDLTGADRSFFWAFVVLQVVRCPRPLLLHPLQLFAQQGLVAQCPVALHLFPIEVVGYPRL